MKPRLLLLVVSFALLCTPLWAWRTVGDREVLAGQYKAFVQGAITDAQQALAANDQAKARYCLLAVSDLCVPSGGSDAKVSAELVAAYKALCLKAWLADQVPTDKDFTAAVKLYAPKLEKAYINAFYLADNSDTYTVKRIADEFSKGASRHPAAVALAIEFSGKALAPEAYQKYKFQGDEGSKAGSIVRVLANIYGGPETIRLLCKEEVVPFALAEAEKTLKNLDPNEKDPGMLRMRARMIEEDDLNLVSWADPENAKLKELKTQVDALRVKARQIYTAQVKSNRVPPDQYGRDDGDALKAAMKKVFFYEPAHTIVRVNVTNGNWTEQARVWTGINAVDVGWYKVIEGAVVIKLTAEGTYWVHPVTFGRRWTGEGDNYGELMVYGWADSYEVLAENVNK